MQVSLFQSIPPHMGFGTPEDSLQSCLSLQPKSAKKDIVRYVYNANKHLRYEARLDWVHPEDKDRKFIILYSLSNCHLSIMEPPIRNSGIIGGRFLSPTLVPKPGTDPSNPEYYTPADIYIGAVLVVFNHRFIITGADLFVHRYAEANPEKFPPEVVDNIRNYMFCNGLLKDDIELRSKQQAEEQREKKRDQMCTENNSPHCAIEAAPTLTQECECPDAPSGKQDYTDTN
uniref:DM10 domain-containing protein n=1 Tax=Timema bartmani TaxID=61472 RepID=A0A7R9I989_9NEOP|nr:unnamed protein product [Timema bartmani]